MIIHMGIMGVPLEAATFLRVNGFTAAITSGLGRCGVVKIDLALKTVSPSDLNPKEVLTFEQFKKLIEETQMRIIFVELLRGETSEKVLEVMTGLGFAKAPERGLLEFGEYVEIDTERKQFSYRRDGGAIPENAKITTLDELRTVLPTVRPGPSYEWLEQQCTALKKQLNGLGYEDRGGVMMVPPVGKTPEYILKDLTVEQAIQAFKEGKSVTVAGKLMTSGTTVEELLDSHLTLKHKRFGRIVMKDQVTSEPDAGALVYRALAFSNDAALVTYSSDMRTFLGSGTLHYTEQGAIDHAEEMARLNRDGFVEMDVDWLVKLKNAVATLEHGLSNNAPLSPEYYSDRLGAMFKSIDEKIKEVS